MLQSGDELMAEPCDLPLGVLPRRDAEQPHRETFDRLVAGLEKKRVMNTKEREIVAYHETGHALVAEALPHVDPVHRVSIIPRGIGSLGYTMQLPTEDRYLMTKTELEERMSVMLGGRVAEELHFGEISTGAHNDLERASETVRQMVCRFGMSETLGPVTAAALAAPLGVPVADAEIARMPITKRGRPGHEKGPTDEFLRRRNVPLVLLWGAHRAVPLRNLPQTASLLARRISA